MPSRASALFSGMNPLVTLRQSREASENIFTLSEFLLTRTKINDLMRPSHPTRGAFRERPERGDDAVDALCATDVTHMRRTAKSCGLAAPMQVANS